MSGGIPDALSFDRIVAGGVCPVSEKTTLRSDTTYLSPGIAMHGPRFHELSEVYRA